MTLKRIFLFFLIIIGSGVAVFGQQPGYIRYTDSDGLPSMNIYDILQDDEGYLWLGTENGLCRFNGREMEIYSSPIITDFEVLTIDYSSDGRIWFSNFSGQLYYIEGGDIFLFDHPSLDPDRKVSSVSIDPMDNLWVTVSGGIYHFIPTGNGAYELGFFYNVGRLNLNHSNVAFTEDGRAWIPYKKDKSIIRADCLQDLPRKDTFPEIMNFDCHIDHLGDNELGVFSRFMAGIVKDGVFFPVFDSLNFTSELRGFTRIFKDKVNQYWVCTHRGVFLFDEAFKPLFDGQMILNRFDINCIIQDQEGNYWIGTNGGGLLMIRSLDISIYNEQNSALGFNQVFSLGIDAQDRLVIGLRNGEINFYQDKTFETTTLPAVDRIMDISLPDGGGSGRLVLAADNGLYFLEGNALTRLDYKKGAFKAVRRLGNSLYMGTSGRLLRMDLETGQLEEIYKRRIYSLHVSADTLWVGTVNGLQHLVNGELNYFTDDMGNRVESRISAFGQSTSGELFLGTYGQGIFSIRNQQIDTLSVVDGLASNIIKSLYIDESDILYVGTDHGLNIYELATENFSLIDRSDGLSSNEINAIMRYDSLIWLGTPQGLCSIVPDGSYTDQLKPPIRIQEFKGGNKRYPVKSGTRFPSNVNDVSIKFSGLSYRSRDKLAYYYLLWKEGEQGNWVRTQNQEVDFPDLSAGQYAFKVVAVNADGYQSTEPAMITFEIVPKWFNRIAVRILIIFFFVALAAFLSYTFFKMKQNRLAQKNAVEVQMNTLRQKALQAQMNPHFIFNAMNSIMHFLSQNDRKSAMDYLAVFARLIRMIFDFSRRELIGLKEEVSFLKHYLQLEQLRFEDRIQTIIEVDESLYNHRVLLPPLLIQPLIENAYKHGLMHKTGKGYLKIQFSDQGSKMLVMIEDNGVGREKARSIQAKSRLVKNHESSGLSTTKDRLNTLNQQNPIAVGQYGLEVIDLYDAYQESVGTRVVLTIPILGS